uniref:C17orf113 probable zinc finger domain-containing protein n=1 Tax=Amphimedon queenslandica TaxID=400682 RepID=A0A1X7SS85_AMPQE
MKFKTLVIMMNVEAQFPYDTIIHFLKTSTQAPPFICKAKRALAAGLFATELWHLTAHKSLTTNRRKKHRTAKKNQLLELHSSESGSSSSSSNSVHVAKKRAVQKKTVQKWVSLYDKELNTSVWLKYDTVYRVHVSKLRCSVCSQFRPKLESMRNFRPAFVDGTSNMRLSTVKDHTATDMHAQVMNLYKKQQSTSVFTYSPIAVSLAQSSLDASTRAKIE